MAESSGLPPGSQSWSASLPAFLRSEGVVAWEPIEQKAVQLQTEGKTVLFVAVQGRPAGILAVADPIKSTTPEAVRELHALGLNLVMITGDNRRTAEAVATRLGIDVVDAEVEPQGEIEDVQKLRAAGKVVAMVGDCVNDAPALAQADVGIAMGTGTDVAMQSAGVTLVKGPSRDYQSYSSQSRHGAEHPPESFLRLCLQCGRQ